MHESTSYSECAQVHATFETALITARTALAAEGFGIVSEIDVQATFAAKLGIDRDPYLILGACNPQIAHQALMVEPQLGTLLPCNVAVFVLDGHTYVSIISAERMLGMVQNPALTLLAKDVGARLERVLAQIRNELTNSG